MKYALQLAAVLFFSNAAFAGSYNCGANGLIEQKQIQAHAFLQSLQGKFQLGQCFVELYVCDPNQPTEPGTTVGDMAVTDKYGKQFYVPFDFSNVQTERVTKVILNGRRMMHYEFIERLPDSNSGRTEAYRLEILKSEDLSTVESLHLGVYTSRLREDYPRLKNRKSYWVICER